MKIRQANSRGHFSNEWLNSWHTFSFSNYYDPNHMGFSSLRVINDDIISAYQGFGFHPHKDMEIITFMLSGELEHKDNLGNTHRLTEGNVQLMRAGTGIVHSEVNPTNKDAHLLQIWIIPNQKNLSPGWWEKNFDIKNSVNLLAEPLDNNKDILLLNSTIEKNDNFQIAQKVYILAISKNVSLNFNNFGESDFYFHVSKNNVTVNNNTLYTGDAIYSENYNNILNIETENGQGLLFIFPK